MHAKFRIILFALVIVLALARIQAQEPVAWQAKAAEFQRFLVEEVDVSDERTASYWQKLKELGALVDENSANRLRAIPSPTHNEVLAIIAGDCVNEPSKLKELLAWYIPSAKQVTQETRRKTAERMKQLGYPENQMVPLVFVEYPRTKNAPAGGEYELFSIHCRPEYRSAWEALYLVPTLSKMRQAQQALEDYEDDRLVTVMEQAFQSMAAIRFKSKFHDSKDSCAQKILQNLWRAGSPKAIRAMLECLDASSKDPFTPVDYGPVPRKISLILTTKRPPVVSSNHTRPRKQAIQFEPMIQDILKDPSLPQRHRDFLSETLKKMPAPK